MFKCPCGYKTEDQMKMIDHVKKMMEQGSTEHVPIAEPEEPKGMSNFYG